MDICCNNKKDSGSSGAPCGKNTAGPCPAAKDARPGNGDPVAWFANMIDNCYGYARQAQASGKNIVGIMCEYTPREIILAAGAVPVCLCGGSLQTIPSAEKHLPSNLCPLIKSTYGYHIQKSNPFLEMARLVVAETTCDGKKKMYELMAQQRKTYILELPQKPADSDAMQHWRCELEKFRRYLQQEFGVEITDQKLRHAVKIMNKERLLRRKLAQMMTADIPPFTGRTLLDFRSIISGISADFENYRKAVELFGKTATRQEDPADKQKPPRRVRVLLTGVPVVHGAERVVDLIEQCGGVIVCMDNCTGLKPILDDIDQDAADIMQAIAEKYFALPCSVMTPNDRRIDLVKELARRYRADCIIDLAWHACITYDVEAFFIGDAARQMGIPYMKIETDYNPSDSARLKVRIEALYEMVNTGGS